MTAKAVEEITPATAPTLTKDQDYSILTNLEMVEYCLPYPSNYQEDYDASSAKGNHVFLSKDKQTKIIFSGNFLDESFLMLYHDCEGEVQEITMTDPLYNEYAEDFFELSWKEGKKLIWLKKWYRKGDEETVTARFEYPEDQSEAMKPVISYVVAATSKCE